MGGTNIGDIFCIVKGDYSVLGPFCTISLDYTSSQEYALLTTSCIDASDPCKSLGDTPLGNGTFCVLNGEYTFIRPEIIPLCIAWGGTKIVPTSTGNYNDDDSHGCILSEKYSIIRPMSWGLSQDIRFKGTEFGENFDLSNMYVNTPEYVILKGEYSVYCPSCFGTDCNTDSSDCLSAGGASFGSAFCAITDVGTNTT